LADLTWNDPYATTYIHLSHMVHVCQSHETNIILYNSALTLYVP